MTLSGDIDLLLAFIPLFLLAWLGRALYVALQDTRSARQRRISGESGRPAAAEKASLYDEKNSSGKEGGAQARRPGLNREACTDPAYLAAFPDLSFSDNTDEQRRQIAADKKLYHQLQNLEDYPDCIASARQTLRELLDQTVDEAVRGSSAGSILSVDHFTSRDLEAYFATAHSVNTHKYEAYLCRRRQGGPRELFPDRDSAVKWLQAAAAVKYVDGSWVGNILSINNRSMSKSVASPSLPTAERNAAKLAFQVISEEFGDGDLKKNHVYVYHELMKQLSPDGQAKTGDQEAFDGLAADEGSPRCWSAAIAQQCVGVLATTDDFFPEALGFNMAYETLPYHLLVTSYELRELMIDDYYFSLHVTIDNPDSGHAALARMAVDTFLHSIRERDGEEAMHAMWRRVQAGVLLADGLPTTPCGPVEMNRNERGSWAPLVANTATDTTPTTEESRLVALLQRKAVAAHKMHCPSRLQLDGKTIEEWLEPSTFTAKKALVLIRLLARRRPWVYTGQPERSKIMQMMGWGGRMFGAFSRNEVAVLADWIISLGSGQQSSTCKGAYGAFIGARAMSEAAAVSSLLGTTSRLSDFDLLRVLGRFQDRHQLPASLACLSAESTAASADLDRPHIAPLWFASISLLETFYLSPSKFATSLGASVLRILRAQIGLPSLYRAADVCAGMDSMFTHGGSSLTDDFAANHRGLWEMMADIEPHASATHPRLMEWIEANAEDPVAELCGDMLELRMRPYSQQALLLGLTHALAAVLVKHVQEVVITDARDRGTTQRIRREMLEAIEVATCDARQGPDGDAWWAAFVAGHRRLVQVVANQ